MRVTAVLNNYQMGSYAYNVLSRKIICTNRLDKSHTEIIWGNVEQWEFNLLKRVIKNIRKIGD